MAGMHYHDYQLQLEPGAELFLYTDGLPEAADGSNQMFGQERMLDTLNSNLNAPPTELLNAINAAVADFVNEAPQFDDLTMMCLRYLGNR